MRVLHISTKVKDNFCGVSTVVEKLLEYQSQVNGVVSEIEYIKEKDIFLKFLYLLKNIKKSDVVVFHKVFSPFSWVLMICCLVIKIEYCIHLHGAFMPNAMKKSYYKKEIIRLFFLNYLVSNSSCLFLLNPEEKKSLNIKVKRCELVPNGIDDTAHFFMDKKKERYISFLSRYDYFGKGIDVLFDSIGEIKEFLIEQKVTIKMHGSFASNLDRELTLNHVQRLNLEEVVSIGEPIYGSEKYKFLADSILMVLPSRSEGMPMVVLEALSVDTYCLVSPYCNVEEILTSCEGGDISKLTPKCLSRLIKREIVSERDVRTQDYIFDNYSWRKISDIYLGVYRSL